MEYVIIGNSAAGIGAAEGIRKIDKTGGITIITSEPYHTYSRPLISYCLQGKVSGENMKYRPANFYSANKCRLVKAAAEKIDAKEKIVRLNNGETVRYDKLLVSTGSKPVIPPFNGLETVKNKFTFTSYDDAQNINSALSAQCRVLIIGAGLIGLKCAEGILKRVSSVTVVDLAKQVLPAVLDETGAKIVRAHMEAFKVRFKLSAGIEKFEGGEAVLSGGERIGFDILIIATGVKPNTGLLEGVAEINRGIIINEKSQTSEADIYAAGDCTECTDISSGQRKIMALLPNAYMQGECAGINMAGGDASFPNAIPMNAAGFFGLHVITAGAYEGEVYAFLQKTYKKIFFSGNRLKGFILIGNIENAGVYTGLIRGRTPLDSIDFKLVCEHPGLMAFSREERAEYLGGVK